jgi:hypothetical protein
VELAMARQEKFTKSGAKPQISAATFHDDLRSRDFTINAIGLSLNRASLGLPIDPTNGIGDVERKELRAIHNYSFYDDPARMLRMIRFKVRLGYTIDERTRLQYENAREAEMLARVSSEALGAELRQMAAEVNVADAVGGIDGQAERGAVQRKTDGVDGEIPRAQIVVNGRGRNLGFRARFGELFLPRHGQLHAHAAWKPHLDGLAVVVGGNGRSVKLLLGDLGELERAALHREIQVAHGKTAQHVPHRPARQEHVDAGVLGELAHLSHDAKLIRAQVALQHEHVIAHSLPPSMNSSRDREANHARG